MIRADIETGTVPAGALLPSSERVAQELAIEEITVQSAFARLLEDGLVAVGEGGILSIASRGEQKSVGEDTQLRFETSLLRALREAQARGLSSTEATGMFKAALQRLGEIEQEKKERNEGEDD